MGVLPLQFLGEPPQFDGSETFTITGIAVLQPRQEIDVRVEADGVTSTFRARVRIDTANELEYFRHGGILHYVLRQLAGVKVAA
jgi:aconitate hydratase